jgi:hypothetical protein
MLDDVGAFLAFIAEPALESLSVVLSSESFGSG